MSDTAVPQAELIVRTIAQTAVDNEKYFCDLDAVVGDGDFGYSLARGFEIVLSDFDDLEYEDAGGLLKKPRWSSPSGSAGPRGRSGGRRSCARARSSRCRIRARTT